MAVVTSDFLSGLLTNFRALFQNDFLAAQNLEGWTQLATKAPSTGENNSYNWFGTVPVMQDTTHSTGDENGLPAYNFTIHNKRWQAFLPVEKIALERDQLDLIRPRISQLAQEAVRHPGYLAFDLIRQNANAYDGSAFFADSRTIGASANIDNNLSGTGTTVAQFQADLGAARSAMRLFQDDQGRPMNLIGNCIMVPAALEQTAYQALNANQGSILNPVTPADASGILRASGYMVVVNPFLTDTNDWFLFHVGTGVDKPFIWQVEKDPALAGATDPNLPEVQRTGKFLYSVEAWYNVGLTDPRFGVRTVNS